MSSFALLFNFFLPENRTFSFTFNGRQSPVSTWSVFWKQILSTQHQQFQKYWEVTKLKNELCDSNRSLVRSMLTKALKTLVQAFIPCRLDYCNSLFYGIAEGLISRLQSVQNAAALLVLAARRYDHISRRCYRSCTGFRFDVGGFQDGHPGLPVTVRHGSSLSSRRLPVGLWRRSSSAAFCHFKEVCWQHV